MGVNIGGMDPTGVGSYNGYPGSQYWNVDSRPLSEATNVLRSFVLQNIVQDNQWEIDRITRYYLFWKFYKGQHYKDFNDGLLSFNYVRAFIDKVNLFLLGDKAFSFKVNSLYSTQVDKEVERLAEELVMYHWNKSGKVQLAYEMLQMGSITGDLWAGVQWEPSEDDEDDYFCKIKVFDSRQCFVTFKNGDFNYTDSFIVRQPLDQSGENSKKGYKLFVQMWTKDTVETWYQKDLSVDYKAVAKFEGKKQKNPYGFIPVVHIKNRPDSSGYYGMSDANDILKINKIYNEMNQQEKAILDYHATPTTVITGASAKSLKKGLGQIWSGLPAEANVFNLGLDVDMSGMNNFVLNLKTAMHELSDIPENALGKIQAISNTSAAALRITYQPIIQQADLKATTYGQGIEQLNKLILRILAIEDPDNERLTKLLELVPNFLKEMKISPVFCYGFPVDKMQEVQMGQQELNMKIASRREIMERMGKDNIPALLEEITQDAIDQAKEQMQIQLMLRSVGVGEGEEGGEGSGLELSEETQPGETEESEEQEENFDVE